MPPPIRTFIADEDTHTKHGIIVAQIRGWSYCPPCLSVHDPDCLRVMEAEARISKRYQDARAELV